MGEREWRRFRIHNKVSRAKKLQISGTVESNAGMGRKVKIEPEVMGSSPNNVAKKSRPKGKKRGHSESDESDVEMPPIEVDMQLPPKDIMSKLLDNIEAQLPREDHVKYDSRAKKLDWEKIKFDNYSADHCKKLWYYVQDRIRRFRIMAELIPDARTWISQPRTNFYKSKDHNRHPDMPKKPLSMYMLFYSEKREEILRSNPTLSMPEVAKICSEQYQKLSDKKKAKYKQRCDDMRRQYEEKLAAFYANYPELKPIKAEKMKKVKTSPVATPVTNPNPNSIPLMPYQPQQQGQVISIGTGQNQQLINVLPLNQ